MSDNAKWYVVHTYSGYENKVKADLEKSIENRNMGDLFVDIQVPIEEVVENKDGRSKVTQRKKFPSYVMIKMVMNDETWYIVRNTRGVTGFVGPGSKPVPLTEEEALNMGIETRTVTVDYQVGDSVKVLDGPLENFIGVVEEISMERQIVKVMVSMFGRETPVELELNQVETLE